MLMLMWRRRCPLTGGSCSKQRFSNYQSKLLQTTSNNNNFPAEDTKQK